MPFKVALSSTGTRDSDGDALTYEWTIEELRGRWDRPRKFSGAETTVESFDKPGVSDATLTVTDTSGASRRSAR